MWSSSIEEVILHKVPESLRVAFRLHRAQPYRVFAQDERLIEAFAFLLERPLLKIVDNRDVDNLLLKLEAVTLGHPLADCLLLMTFAVRTIKENVITSIKKTLRVSHRARVFAYDESLHQLCLLEDRVQVEVGDVALRLFDRDQHGVVHELERLQEGNVVPHCLCQPLCRFSIQPCQLSELLLR